MKQFKELKRKGDKIKRIDKAENIFLMSGSYNFTTLEQNFYNMYEMYDYQLDEMYDRQNPRIQQALDTLQ